jgi:hypothetical protein
MSSWVYWEQFTWGFPTWQPWNDVIKVVAVTEGAADTLEFVLTSASYVEWYKAIQITDCPVWFGTAWTAASDHGPRSLIVPYIPVFLDTAALEFVRTGWFGIATGLYKVGDLQRYRGKRVFLDWQWDWGNSTLNGFSRPAPSPPVPGA